ncbi:hypothetical protein SLS55_008904 [Diplodia seriata]|uniref:Uncharacterized protein n=1 Tax=Diplodia seriata TaxID=420778 RepID=A0A1S8BGP3_9PEZI|nr:hypothetical protein BK809_0003633 [Diplodia seriata]
MATRPRIRTASAEGSLQLSQPTPDLHSPTDGFATHVERLEKHAERMSSSGSDIGEEIRKLQLEEKEQSRRSSLASHAHQDADNAKPVPAGRSRNTSISSYNNSIVDVNSQARWGGYSPSAYVTSPKGSIRSGSWSHRSGVQRQHSVSQTKGSLDDFPENIDEAETATVHNEPQPAAADYAQLHARNASQFSLEYDKIVQDIENELATVPSQESAPAAGAYGRVAHGMLDPDELPDRPATADTYQQAQTAFRDFDGVHCAPGTTGLREISEGREHAMLHSIPHDHHVGVPPPDDGMIYYPAPVPKMLNLPKRLSQLPTNETRNKRRSQVLGGMVAEARNSALWLGGTNKPDNRKSANPRQSVHMDKLPPQLRASVYFDQPNVPHDVEIKGESARATLDDILDASTSAPVSAFTDHPVAGPVGKAVYGKENKRKSMLEKRKSASSLLDMDKRKSSATMLGDDEKTEKEAKKEKRKSSFGFLLGRRSSTDEVSKHLKKKSSSGKMNKLQKRNSSQMSLSNALEQGEAAAQQKRRGSTSSQGSNVNESTAFHSGEHHDDAYNGMETLSRDGSDNYDDEGQFDDEDGFIGAPTTLLAELQMRKAQQRERNRTAATAFPNGMHSTLLQLDAVAEVEKRKRQNQRVNLAWEAPNQEDEDDEVPLGMLFPGQNGLANRAGQGAGGRGDDWDRPLGLLEKKELEDSEPLSRRRNRLRGLHPDTPGNRMTMLSAHSQSQEAQRSSNDPTPEPPQAKEESEDEEEPLAARRERLKRKEALNSALGDMDSRPFSGDFASEMMSQFGGLKDGEEKDGTKGASPKTPGFVNEEEETLGQRRARLQAEALARGSTTPSGLSPGNPLRPPLKASRSLADILSAHPAGHQADKISNDLLLSSLPQGSLLQKSEQKAATRQAYIRDGNKRSTSYGLEKPLLDVGPPNDGRAKSMVLDGSSGERGLLGKGYDTGLAAAQAKSGARTLDKRASTMALGTNNMNMSTGNLGMSMPAMNQSGFINPQAGMMGMGVPMQQQPMMMGMGMPMQSPMPMPMNMNMNMNMGMGMPMGMGGMNMGMGGGGMTGFPPAQMMMGQPYGMQPMGGMQMGMPAGMGMGMGVGNQMQMDPSMLDSGRRAAIDRWRQDISY